MWAKNSECVAENLIAPHYLVFTLGYNMLLALPRYAQSLDFCFWGVITCHRNDGAPVPIDSERSTEHHRCHLGLSRAENG